MHKVVVKQLAKFKSKKKKISACLFVKHKKVVVCATFERFLSKRKAIVHQPTFISITTKRIIPKAAGKPINLKNNKKTFTHHIFTADAAYSLQTTGDLMGRYWRDFTVQ